MLKILLESAYVIKLEVLLKMSSFFTEMSQPLK